MLLNPPVAGQAWRVWARAAEALRVSPGVVAAVRHLPAEEGAFAAAEVAAASVVVVAAVVVDGAPTSH